MLTNNYLVSETPNAFGGTQRIYKFPNGMGLSVINGAMLHNYPFAWEVAVLDKNGGLCYDTALTEDIEVFQTDEETNAFIEKAAVEIGR